MKEAERSQTQYISIHQVFTRRLQPNARPIDQQEGVMISPVDGRLRAVAPIPLASTFRVKGQSYSIDSLLGVEGALHVFKGGTMITVYLAPSDYHRIHSPVDGEIVQWRHIFGTLYPVNGIGLRWTDQLYIQNERVITELDSPEWGRVAVVKVGAALVGSIQTTYQPKIVLDDRLRHQTTHRTICPPIFTARGAELGVFEMGSTVILLTQRPVAVKPRLNTPLRMGQALAAIVS